MAGMFTGIPIGKFTGEGANFDPYIRMKQIMADEQDNLRQEALARAGMQMDQNALAFDQSMDTRRFEEGKRQFDLGLAESQAERADRLAIADKARSKAGGSGDLTKREELAYDHLNYQLTIAKYMLSKAQTSEDRAKYQQEIDSLNAQITKILQPGDQAGAAPAIMPPPQPKVDDQAPKALPYSNYILPPPHVAPANEAKKVGGPKEQPKAKLLPEVSGSTRKPEMLDPERAKRSLDDMQGPSFGAGGMAEAAAVQQKLDRARQASNGLTREQIIAARDQADMVAANDNLPGGEAADYLRPFPGALELYEWWIANGKKGKPSDAWR